MIDKTRVEDLLQDADASEADGLEMMTVRVATIHGVLAEHRDMRAIVEALAEMEDFIVNDRTSWSGTRAVCPACGASSDAVVTEHSEGCIRMRAVALIAPASERKEE